MTDSSEMRTEMQVSDDLGSYGYRDVVGRDPIPLGLDDASGARTGGLLIEISIIADT